MRWMKQSRCADVAPDFADSMCNKKGNPMLRGLHGDISKPPPGCGERIGAEQ
jgi:hypothetical protein